ncbi:MAG: ATP-binding SpoIIE family protein phosphatase [Candidatus Sericytochromatia bacterium]
METILLIEDQPDTRALIAHFLERAGYAVLQAAEARTGLALLRAHAPDLVLLDIQLPGQSGLELLAGLQGQGGMPPVIMLTASAERIEEAFALGARDFLRKPFAQGELLARVGNVLAAVRVTRERERLLQELRADLGLAEQVQQLFLPTLPAHGLVSMAYHYRPLEGVSGDMMGFQAVGPDHVAFYLGDVSGHGMPAALLMTALGSCLEGLLAAGEREPWCLLQQASLRMHPVLERHYVTLVAGALELSTGRLTLCNAGHPPLLLLRQGRALPLAGGGTMPIGLAAAADFGAWVQTEHALQPGDRLLLYSDGLFEGLAPEHGHAELCERAAAFQGDLTALCQQLPTQLATAHDDCSLMALELNALQGQHVLPAQLEALESLLPIWQARLGPLLSEAQLGCLHLLWLEYAGNVVRHGGARQIQVTYTLGPAHLELLIRDDGPAWERPVADLPADPFAESGRGLWLIEQLSTTFELRREDARANLARLTLALAFDAPILTPGGDVHAAC